MKMKLDIKERKDDSLFGRERVDFNVIYDGKTPSRLDLKKQLSTQLKVDEKLVVVRKVDQKFGDASAKCEAIVYKDESSLKSLEKKKYVTKNTVPEETKEEVKEKAPAEEKKEESKEEKEPVAEEKESVKEEATAETKEEAKEEVSQSKETNEASK
jgi:small subunit ribosomal protein S24e